MVELLFNSLLLITAVVGGLYCLFHERKSLIYLGGLTILSLLLVNLAPILSFIMFIPLALPFFKKMSFENTVTSCMIPTITVAHFVLAYIYTLQPVLIILAILSVTAICALGILGTFEDRILKYLLISNLLQLIFVILDLSVGAIVGKLEVLGTIQIFNYTFAGLLLFITMGILSANGKRGEIKDLEGLFYGSKANSSFAIIAAVSLAGLPGLNIFVSEWFLFVTGFAINPMITVMGIFAALVLFIMYFKIGYVMLVGQPAKSLAPPKALTGAGAVLAILCVLLGVVPQLQMLILTGGI